MRIAETLKEKAAGISRVLTPVFKSIAARINNRERLAVFFGAAAMLAGTGGLTYGVADAVGTTIKQSVADRASDDYRGLQHTKVIDLGSAGLGVLAVWGGAEVLSRVVRKRELAR
jgi:hypothetical protein